MASEAARKAISYRNNVGGQGMAEELAAVRRIYQERIKR